MTLAFAFLEQRLWSHIPIEDPRAKELHRRHYSCKIPESDDDGLVAPGRRFLLLHEGPGGRLAIWAVVLNRWKAPGWDVGEWRWRNSIFRNESITRSSELIKAATADTYEMWLRRYKELPTVPLTSEIDIEATREHRSPWHEPGWCYKKAGWTWVKDTPREHGRSSKAIWKAPAP